MKMDKIVCVDLDGVLAYYEEWRGEDYIGPPNEEGVKLIRLLKDAKIKIIVDTCRMNHRWPDCDYVKQEELIRRWLAICKIPYDELWTSGGKPFANAYIDDRSVNFQKNIGPADEVFKEVLKIIGPEEESKA
jgi:hypothetical protein